MLRAMKPVRWIVGFVVASGLACSGLQTPSEPEEAVVPDTPTEPPTPPPDVDTGLAIPVAAPDEPEPPPDAPPVVPTPEPPAPVGKRPVAAPVPVAGPEPAPSPPPPAGDDDDDDGKKGAKSPPAPAPPGITQVSDRSWTGDPEPRRSLAGRSVPPGQRPRGGRGLGAAGVRQRNAYHLGMRNKELLLEINGHKLTPARTDVAYLACKNDREFDLVFLRAGKRIVHHYAIQKCREPSAVPDRRAKVIDDRARTFMPLAIARLVQQQGQRGRHRGASSARCSTAGHRRITIGLGIGVDIPLLDQELHAAEIAELDRDLVGGGGPGSSPTAT